MTPTESQPLWLLDIAGKNHPTSFSIWNIFFLPFSNAWISLVRDSIWRERPRFSSYMQASLYMRTHSIQHTHLSDIRSLYCLLKFSGSQISTDERISIKHVWDAARNQELWTSYLHRSPCPSNPSFFLFHYPSASLSQSRSPQWFSPSLPFSPLSLSFSPSCLSCLWQIGKLCFTNVGTCVKWGSIVCLTGCLY